MKRTITPTELNEKPSEFTVIDVRRKTDYDGEVILDAQWHDPEQVEKWAKDLPKEPQDVYYLAESGRIIVSNGGTGRYDFSIVTHSIILETSHFRPMQTISATTRKPNIFF